MNLLAHSVSPGFILVGIRSLTEFGNPVRPLAQSVLYPLQETSEAIPKYFSGRTSYRHVWLAFHPYPQLIRELFNVHQFGPPRSFTSASTWPWVDHVASGLFLATKSPYSDSVSLRLHLLWDLTSLQKITRGPIMQKVRCHTLRCFNWL